MATSSRIKAVKTQIKTILDAYASLSGVQITRSHPGELMQREAIWIGNANFEADWANIGTGYRREQDIDVDIIVRVEQEGDDGPTLDDRALDLANHVEEALRANPNLNNEVVMGGVTGFLQDSFIEDAKRVSAIRLTCTYQARKGA